MIKRPFMAVVFLLWAAIYIFTMMVGYTFAAPIAALVQGVRDMIDAGRSYFYDGPYGDDEVRDRVQRYKDQGVKDE